METKYKPRKFILGVKLIIFLLLKNPANSKDLTIEPIVFPIGSIDQKQKVLKTPSIEIPNMEPSLSNWRKVSPIKFRTEKGIRKLQIKYILFQLEKSLLGDENKSQNQKRGFPPKKRKAQVQTWTKFVKELEEEKFRESIDFINLNNFKMD